jgi:glutamyl/glutaminyl-tRNA synthetase
MAGWLAGGAVVHLPLMLASDGSKLSKRRGAAAVGPSWRPFWLRFTYATSVLVTKD